MAFCPNCGKEFDGIGKFCSSCGYLIVSDTAPQAAPQAQPAYSAPAPQQNYAAPAQQAAPQRPAAPQYNYNNAPQQNYAAPTPQQPAYNYGPVANIARSPINTNYSLLKYILLTILTLGIYGLIVTHNLAKDTNQMCAEDGQKTSGVVMVIILSLFTLGIYSYFWYYNVQSRLHNAAPRYGAVVSEDGSSVLIWFIVGLFIPFISLIGMNIIFNSANNLGNAYNARYFRR